MDCDELGAWLRLLLTPGIGRATARRLLAAFGAPQAVFDAPAAAWREIAGPARAAALAAVPPKLGAVLALTQEWLAGEPSRRILTLGDADYPALLLQTEDPPLLLHLQGRIELLATDSLAIVGSRNPTPQGADNARAFARHLSGAGWTIVSGLALGIDGAAHEGALDGPGSTIAVLGTGIDRPYPLRHAALGQRIGRDGLLLSELPLGTPPVAENFPQRNRIIAGLSRGTLVVEAALQSGSLITARLAAEAGREVFAVPGSIHSPQSRGCHALIRQGAKLVEIAQDLLEELQPGRPALAHPPAPAPASTPAAAAAAPARLTEDPLLQALGHDPSTLDALVARTGMPAPELAVRLLELELEGALQRLPGGLFHRRVAT